MKSLVNERKFVMQQVFINKFETNARMFEMFWNFAFTVGLRLSLTFLSKRLRRNASLTKRTENLDPIQYRSMAKSIKTLSKSQMFHFYALQQQQLNSSLLWVMDKS